MCSLSSYKQRERWECGYSRRFYRLNVYTTNLYPPTGALDSKNGQEIVRLLKESNQKYGQTLLLVTHDENIALQAERIVTIADGKVVRDSKEKRKTARMEGQSAVKRERKVERP